MPTLPEIPHRIHLFKSGNDCFAADLERFHTVQLSPCAWEYLSLCQANAATDALEALGTNYSAEEIEAALDSLTALQKNGRLSAKSEWVENGRDSQRRQLFIPQPITLWYQELDHLTAGTNMALHHMVANLARSVDIHFAGQQFREIDEGIFETPISYSAALSAPWQLEQGGYLGILALHWPPRGNEMLPFFERVNLPVLLQIHAPRGHGGDAINSVLRHYAAMRAFDGFTVPSQPVVDFYRRFVLDTDCFFVLPNGYEPDLFQPMDKTVAKQKMAELARDPRITQQPIVGYLSRLQPEKGALVFLKLAKRLPDVLFLLGGRKFSQYATHRFPPNVVYAGFLPRNELPVLYNAFDIYCFPTLSGEETFGLTLLEAMACGVPAVIPNWGGMPQVMGDGGIAVEADTFSDDIGSFAAGVSPEALAEGIHRLLTDEALRQALGQAARKQALTFSWEATAERILAIFEQLHRRKQRSQSNPFWTRFVPKLNAAHRTIQPEAALLNLTELWEIPLMRSGYPQTLMEGLALSLARRHTPHEVETVLWELCENREEVEQVYQRVRGFIEAAT